MKRFEYDTITFSASESEDIIKTLNGLGHVGWQVVSTLPSYGDSNLDHNRKLVLLIARELPTGEAALSLENRAFLNGLANS